MAPDKNISSKETKRAPRPWVVPSLALVSSSSKSSKPQKNLMSAPSFSMSPRTSKPGGRARPPPPPPPPRTDDDRPASETPLIRARRNSNDLNETLPKRNNHDPSSDEAGPSTRMLVDSLQSASASTSTRPPGSSSKRSRPLTTPSKHLPPPPTYNLPRPSPKTIKPLAPISAVLPAKIKSEPFDLGPSPKRERSLVGLSGILDHVDVKDEIDGAGGSIIGGGPVDARELLNGKSPSKGKKGYKGVLPLSSNASLLLASHHSTLTHFYTHLARHPPPDLHLLVLSLAPASPIKPRLVRTTCRILPPSEPGSPTKAGGEDDKLDEGEAVGTVLLMMPEGVKGAGREVGVGRTVKGWRPWLEVGVGEGGERVLMLDKFEVE